MAQQLLDILQLMGETLRIPTSFVVIEFLGTLAAAVSGIRLASAKKFDWFGAYIVGMATATGGGTLRDVLLGVPPFWLTNPMYAVCCAIALGLVLAFGRKIIRENNTWFIFDTIGLALFNIVGLEKTLNMGYPVWTAIAMGCITGAAGGILRDILINEVPLIFRREIYAMACVAGGVVYVIGYSCNIHAETNAILSAITVVSIRLLAVKYHWNFPILKGDDTKD